MAKHIKRFMLKGTLSSNLGPKYGLLISACVYIYIYMYFVYIYMCRERESLVINVINFFFFKIIIALSLVDIPKNSTLHTHTYLVLT